MSRTQLKGRSRWNGRVVGPAGWLGLLVAVGLVAACGDCSDEIEAGRAFLDKPANLSCQTDQDCVVVSTGCQTFARGVCEQAQLNRGAAVSAQWQRLSQGLSDCQNSCSQCAVALIAHCDAGFCGGKP